MIPTWSKLAWKALSNPPRSRTQFLDRAFHQIEFRSSHSAQISPLLHICFVTASPRTFLAPRSLPLHLEIRRLRKGLAIKKSTSCKIIQLCQIWSQTMSFEEMVCLRRGFTLLGLFTPARPIANRLLTEAQLSGTSWVPAPEVSEHGSASSIKKDRGECITLFGPVDFKSWHSFGPIDPCAAILNISMINHILATDFRFMSSCFLFLNLETQRFVSDLTTEERKRIFPPGSTIVAKPDSRGFPESSFARKIPEGCELIRCRTPNHLYKIGSPNMAQNAVWHLLHSFAKVNLTGFNLFTSNSKYESLPTGRSTGNTNAAQRCGFSQHDPLFNWFFLKRLRNLGLIGASAQLEQLLALSASGYLEQIQAVHGAEFR